MRQNYLGGTGVPMFGGTSVPFGAASTDFNGKRHFNKFTPRASISFKPTRDHMVYASYSKGFKGGGFDPRGVGVNAPDLNGNGTREQDEIAAFIGFEPETVDSYEIGYKASLFDNRLNLALAAFRANYKNVQIPGSSGYVVTVSYAHIDVNKRQPIFWWAPHWLPLSPFPCLRLRPLRALTACANGT